MNSKSSPMICSSGAEKLMQGGWTYIVRRLESMAVQALRRDQLLCMAAFVLYWILQILSQTLSFLSKKFPLLIKQLKCPLRLKVLMLNHFPETLHFNILQCSTSACTIAAIFKQHTWLVVSHIGESVQWLLFFGLNGTQNKIVVNCAMLTCKECYGMSVLFSEFHPKCMFFILQ